MEKRDRIAGGFYGLLIGDALGVPYEFYKADQLPAYEEIDMTPPAGFKKTYPQVDVGTWSDDGAQALCLLDSLLSRKGFSLDSFSDMLLAWYEDGAWAVGNKVFDVACVPQFDTMHPSMSLGAFFNDRNFRHIAISEGNRIFKK